MEYVRRYKIIPSQKRDYVNSEVNLLKSSILTSPSQDDLNMFYFFLTDKTDEQRWNEAQHLFTEFLLKFDTKLNGYKSIRNKFLDKVTKSHKDYDVFVDLLIGNVKAILPGSKEEIFRVDLKELRLLLTTSHIFINICRDEKATETVAHWLIPLFITLSVSFIHPMQCPGRKEEIDCRILEIFSVVDAIFSQIITLFSKQYLFELLSETAILCRYSIRVVDDPYFSFDLRCKSGMIFVHSFCRNEENSFDETYRMTKKKWDTLDNGYFSMMKRDEALFIIYSCLFKLATLQNQLDFHVGDKTLYEFIFEKLVSFSKRSIENSLQTVEISRSLLAVSQTFNRLTPAIFSLIFFETYSYCQSYFEYHINVIRKNTGLILSNLINEACFYVKKGDTTYVDYLISNLKINMMPKKIDFSIVIDICRNDIRRHLYEKLRNFDSLKLVHDPILADDATKMYEILTETYHELEPFEEWFETWVSPIKGILNSIDPESIEYVHRMLRKASGLDPGVLRRMFPTGGDNYRESAAMLKCLGLVRDSRTRSDDGDWLGLIEKDKLERFLRHRDETVRISAVRLIIECARTTETYSPWELEMVLDFYRFNSGVQSACSRKQIVTAYKRAIVRLFAGYEVIKRNRSSLDAYSAFVDEFAESLLSNISPGSNCYQRMVALELLVFFRPFMGDDWATIWTENDIDHLKRCLLDAYEDNQKLALSLLKTFDAETLRLESAEAYFNKALEACVSANASGACYMFELYSSLRAESVSSTIVRLNGTIGTLSSCSELLRSIRRLIETLHDRDPWPEFKNALDITLSTCERAFEIVVPIISDPMQEQLLSARRGDGQGALARAWRTTREIVFLLAEIARRTVTSAEYGERYRSDMLRIGGRFERLFFAAKHRGVFEQAFVGFADLCDCYWRSRDLNALPSEWLDEALLVCLGSKTDDRLCSTRRSAGLPFMIMGIIVSEPTEEKKTFHRTMRVLIESVEEARPELEDAQIHCFNVLRTIFRNSKLGEIVVPYVDKSVVAALNGMSSGSWRVRNSSTLLFAALITRIFGVEKIQDGMTGKHKLTLKVFSTRYPLLFDFSLDVLRNESGNNLLLYPVLLILSKLYPCLLDETIGDSVADKFLSHDIYEVRKLAARASLSFLLSKGLGRHVEHNFSIVGSMGVTNNRIHGILMQTSYLFKYFGDKIEFSLSNVLKSSYKIMLFNGRVSQHTVALYMEILSFLLLRRDECINKGMLKNILKIIAILNGNHSMEPYLKRSIFNLTITIIFYRLKPFDSILMENIFRDLTKKSRNHFLKFMLCLNSSYRERYYNKHPLLDEEEFEIPEDLRLIVDRFPDNLKLEILTKSHDFISRFLIQEIEKHDENVLLLADYYPCFIKELKNPINWKYLCFVLNDEIKCTAFIGFVGLVLMNTGLKLEIIFNEDPILHRRLILAELMVKVKETLDFDLFQTTVMSLYWDENVNVRNTISMITDDMRRCEETFAERSKMILFEEMGRSCNDVSYRRFLFGIFSNILKDTAEMEDNFYRETVTLVYVIGNLLNKNVWQETGNDTEDCRLAAKKLSSGCFIYTDCVQLVLKKIFTDLQAFLNGDVTLTKGNFTEHFLNESIPKLRNEFTIKYYVPLERLLRILFKRFLK